MVVVEILALQVEMREQVVAEQATVVLQERQTLAVVVVVQVIVSQVQQVVQV